MILFISAGVSAAVGEFEDARNPAIAIVNAVIGLSRNNGPRTPDALKKMASSRQES